MQGYLLPIGRTVPINLLSKGEVEYKFLIDEYDNVTVFGSTPYFKKIIVSMHPVGNKEKIIFEQRIGADDSK